MIVDKYVPLNCINGEDAVWEPLYHEDAVLIDVHKIKRSKLDIKLEFSKVNETSEYYGTWFISRKNALKYRKTYNNNGRTCIRIPFKEFERLQIAERSLHDL